MNISNVFLLCCQHHVFYGGQTVNTENIWFAVPKWFHTLQGQYSGQTKWPVWWESVSVWWFKFRVVYTSTPEKDHWIVAWISFREKIIIPLSSRSSLSVLFFCRWTHQGQCSVCKNSIMELGTQLNATFVEHKGAHQWWTARLEHHGSIWNHLPQTAYQHSMHTAQCFS